MRPGELPQSQLWHATMGVLLVSAFYSYPRSAAEDASTAAPWAVLLAGVAAFFLLLPVVRRLARGNGQNLVDAALDGGGRPLAIFTALALCTGVIIDVGLGLRQASELVVTALYPHTPQTFAMSTLLIASAVGAAISPANLFWLAARFAWPALVSILLLMLGNAGWGQVRNLMPMTGHGVLPTLGEVLPLSSQFAPLILLLIFCSMLPSQRRLPQITGMAVGVASATWAALIFLYLMVFPLPGGLSIPFPLFEMSRLVQGGRFLERVDAVWIVVWAFGSALRTAMALMVGSQLFGQAFRLPDRRGAVLPLAIATMTVALFPSNQASAISLEHDLFRRFSFLGFFGLPLLVTLVASLRRTAKGGAPNT